ncbi:MAG: hypothetical protein KKH98_11405, partial [Spirochaetes bacterium]|nr:hypothetical protein [Spirochaetota bacterium]
MKKNKQLKNIPVKESAMDNLMDFKMKDKNIIILLGMFTLILFYKVLFSPPISPDFVSQFFPFTKYWKSFFASHGTLAFWLPNINAGTPNLDQGTFFPLFNIFTTYLFPSDLASGIGYMIIVFLTGVFSFIFFNSLKMNRFSAFLSSIIYMLSGSLISYFYPGHIGKPIVMALIPLTLFLINAGLKKRKWYYFFFTGL